MSPDILIRPYTPSDYHAVQAILQEGGLYFEPTDTAESLDTKIARNPGSIIVAEEDGGVIGTVFAVEDGWATFLFRLAVRKTHRHHGIGRRLAQAAEHYVQNKGYPEVNILVSEDNKDLMDVYKRWGYKEGGLFRWMYKEF